jgi:hypothetical protein
MNKVIISVTLIAFFAVGTVIALMSLEHMKDSTANTSQYDPAAQADWPVYTFNKIMNEKADLVAFVTVESIEDKQVNEGLLGEKVASLKINKLLYDSRNSIDKSSATSLVQAVDFVKVGESYLLFLRKEGDYYYEVDGNSKIKEVNAKYQVNIEGIQGSYTQETFGQKFSSTLQEIKK